MEQADPKAVSEALSIASRIRETMQTDGWPWIRQILEENVKAMNDINDVKSLKELQAKQMASRVLKAFLADLDGVVQASEHKVKAETTSKTFEGGYSIFKLHDK